MDDYGSKVKQHARKSRRMGLELVSSHESIEQISRVWKIHWPQRLRTYSSGVRGICSANCRSHYVLTLLAGRLLMDNNDDQIGRWGTPM